MHKAKKTETFHPSNKQGHKQSRLPFIFYLLCIVNAAITSTSMATHYYVDPENGDISNNGSAASPWNTLQAVFSNGLIGTTVQPGDTVFLRSGYHGAIDYESASNSDYITFAAETGHTPDFSSISLNNVRRVKFKGIRISPELAPGPYNSVSRLFYVRSSSYIILEDSTLFSVWDSSNWGLTEWNNIVAHGVYSDGNPNIIVRNNYIKNVGFGIVTTGDNVLVEHNIVENFATDGMRGGGDDQVFQYNVVKNCYDVSSNHDDGIQVYTGSGGPPALRTIIRGNIFINNTEPERSFIGSLQGIGCFMEGGKYIDWIVENNIIITPHTNGLVVKDAVDSRIVNNIVFNPYGGGNVTGISLRDAYQNCIVRNNMAHGFPTSNSEVTSTNNLDIDNYNPDDLFVQWRDITNFDLRHKPGSPAIDTGTSEDAPSIDILGTSRPQGTSYDVGAYEYLSGPPDTTVPSVPQNLNGQPMSETRIDLTWLASTDPESGVSYYKIYRDDLLIDTTTSTSYSDTSLISNTTYVYQISAVNGSGLESGLSNTFQATTLSDTIPPSIVSVSATETSVEIVFNEPLNTTSAESTNNYSINNGISVIAASLDTETVTLRTSAHAEGSYTLTVVNVQDVSGNPMISTTIDYEYKYGLVSHWKFDDGTSNTASDSSGSGNHGTLMNGPIWTSGRYNGALSFDGSNDYVEVPDDPSFDIADEITISAWINPVSASGWRTIVSKFAHTPAYRTDLYWFLSNGRIGASLAGPSGIPGDNWTPDVPVETGTWMYVALTYDGSAMVMYKNGNRMATTSVNGALMLADSSSNESLQVGANTEWGEHFYGIIDEVRIYNRALSTAEIVELYGQIPPADTNAPVISNIALSNITSSGATITWNTDENSTSQVEYGLDTTYGSATNLDTSLITSHSVALTWLSPSTTYHFRVKSADTSGNESISQDNTLTTDATTTFSIIASAGGGGTISPIGTTQVASGGSQVYTITANSGYHISDVIVDGSSVGALSSYTFSNVTTNHTITAAFAINTYTITATAGSDGTISPSGTTQVAYGGSQAYTITANSGYHISDVTVDGSSVGVLSSYTFSNVTANHTITATYAINTYTITATAGDGGQISPSGTTQVASGDSQAYTITADPGYKISNVLVDGSSVGAVTSYSFTNVTSNRTIAASFAIDEIDVTAPAVTNLSPQADSIQAQLNTLITLDIIDSGNGVDANSVKININNNTVYSGNSDKYSSTYGECYRTGTKANYTFIYQSKEKFNFDQIITVKANASDLVGNSMDEYLYSFKTKMRAFGKNKKVNKDNHLTTDSAEFASIVNNNRPKTCCDSKGNIWATWHAGPTSNKDIYIGKLTAGSEAFGNSMKLTESTADQRNPTIAVGSDDKLYVAWQDSRRGNWDIYMSTSTDGINWSAETRVTDSNDNQYYPVIVVDSSNNVYIAWEDSRNGNQDIYIGASNNGFITKTISQITSNSSDQVDQAIAVDSDNTVYIVWKDTRNGNNDIYGAASNNGPWTNIPVVTTEQSQSSPAIATESVGSILHLVWVDNTPGNNDIYYAKTTSGLPASPLIGSSIIDDTTGADQLQPAIVVSGSTSNNLLVFVCWKDERNADYDIYFAELGSGTGTNIFVDDDGTNTGQSDPAIGIDGDGYPFLVWTDNRNTNTDIYYAGSTSIESTALASGNISTSSTTTLETADGVSIVVPAGAYPCNIKITISEVKNPPKTSKEYLSLLYDFGPSGLEFEPPVTITIPYEVIASDYLASAYWYNLLTASPSQQGITDIETIMISSTPCLRFKTTHFTQFFVGGSSSSGGISVSGGSGGGGCSMSANGQASALELLLPYIGLTITMVVLKLKDKRKSKARDAT